MVCRRLDFFGYDCQMVLLWAFAEYRQGQLPVVLGWGGEYCRLHWSMLEGDYFGTWPHWYTENMNANTSILADEELDRQPERDSIA